MLLRAAIVILVMLNLGAAGWWLFQPQPGVAAGMATAAPGLRLLKEVPAPSPPAVAATADAAAAPSPSAAAAPPAAAPGTKPQAKVPSAAIPPAVLSIEPGRPPIQP